MIEDVTEARRIADKRHASAVLAAKRLADRFGLPDDLITELIREFGSNQAKLDAAARRLADY